MRDKGELGACTHKLNVARRIFVPYLLCLSLLASVGSYGQEPRIVDPPVTRPEFNLIRFDEDWSVLQHPELRTDYLDAIKYIPLPEPGSYLSIGGEFRGVFERLRNDNWSPLPYEVNSFGLQRYMLHLDAHLNPHVRLFVQLESGIEQGRPAGPRPIDAKRLDFLNAFVDYRPSVKKSSPQFRVGKQEMQFGAGRLISVREGPNIRQGFFGFRADEAIDKWNLTGFAVKPAEDNYGYFDDGPTGAESLWGVQATRDWNHVQHYQLNPYYYGLDRKTATFQQGTGHELRHVVGARFLADPPQQTEGRRTVTHSDLEATFQTGRFGNNEIRAWGLATENGIGFPRLPMFPKLGLHADASSGDQDPKQGRLQTYNALFPNGNYFGIFADTGPGPVNYRDLRPDLIFSPRRSLTITFDELLWWRSSLKDGVYNIPGDLIVPAGRSQARFVGHRPGIEAYWQVNRHVYIQSDYGVFLAGPFLRESGMAHNLVYTSVWLGYKF